MKLPLNFKPQFVCSKDQTRYVLLNAYLKNGLAYATNGKSLVAAMVETTDEDQATEGFLPVEALKVATKKRAKNHVFQGLIEMHSDGMTKVFPALGVTTTFVRCCDGTYPAIHKVLPEHEKPMSFSLDAKLLLDVAQALGSDRVQITIDQAQLRTCFIVQTKNDTDRFGLIMPVDYHNVIPPNECLARVQALNEPTP